MVDTEQDRDLVLDAWEDPKFHKMDVEDRRAWMNSHDPKFKMLPLEEQNKLFTQYYKEYAILPPKPVVEQKANAIVATQDQAAEVAAKSQPLPPPAAKLPAEPGWGGAGAPGWANAAPAPAPIPTPTPPPVEPAAPPPWRTTYVGDAAQIELPPEQPVQPPSPVVGKSVFDRLQAPPRQRPALTLPGSTGPLPAQPPQAMGPPEAPRPPQPPQPLIKGNVMPIAPLTAVPSGIPTAHPQGVQINPEEYPGAPAPPIMLGAGGPDPAKAGYPVEINRVAEPLPDKDDAAQAARDLRILFYGPADGVPLSAGSNTEKIVNGLLRFTNGLSTPEGILLAFTGAGLASRLPSLINTPEIARALAKYPKLAQLLHAASEDAVSTAFGAYGVGTGVPTTIEGIKEGDWEKTVEGLGGIALGGLAAAHVRGNAKAAAEARPGGIFPKGRSVEDVTGPTRSEMSATARDLAGEGSHIAAEQWRERARQDQKWAEWVAANPLDGPKGTVWLKGHSSKVEPYARQPGPALLETNIDTPYGKIDKVVAVDGRTLYSGRAADVANWLQVNGMEPPNTKVAEAEAQYGTIHGTKPPDYDNQGTRLRTATNPDQMGVIVDRRPAPDYRDARLERGANLKVEAELANQEAATARETGAPNAAALEQKAAAITREFAEHEAAEPPFYAPGMPTGPYRRQDRPHTTPPLDITLPKDSPLAAPAPPVAPAPVATEAPITGNPAAQSQQSEPDLHGYTITEHEGRRTEPDDPPFKIYEIHDPTGRSVGQTGDRQGAHTLIEERFQRGVDNPAAQPQQEPTVEGGIQPAQGYRESQERWHRTYEEAQESGFSERQARDMADQGKLPPGDQRPYAHHNRQELEDLARDGDEEAQKELDYFWGELGEGKAGRHVTYYTGAGGYDNVAKSAKERGDIGVVVTPQNPGYIDKEDYPHIMVDNGGFTADGFEPEKFTKLLDKVATHKNVGKVRFVVAPDVPFDAEGTRALFDKWAPIIQNKGLPVAFAFQNGAENNPDMIPWGQFDTLFVAGDDDFKEGKFTDPEQRKRWRAVIDRARESDIPIHIGRVNSNARLSLTAYGHGAISMDGTHIGKAGPAAGLASVHKWLDTWNRGSHDNEQDGFIDNAADEAIGWLEHALDQHIKHGDPDKEHLQWAIGEAQQILRNTEGMGLRDDKAKRLEQLIEAAKGSLKPMRKPGHPAAGATTEGSSQDEPASLEPYQMKQHEYVNQHLGEEIKFPANSILTVDLDNETMESMMRWSIPELRQQAHLMGTKMSGTKAEMLHDVFRVWAARKELRNETEESIANMPLPDVHRLLKAIGTQPRYFNKSTGQKHLLQWRDDQRKQAQSRVWQARHEGHVSRAVDEGKDVPEHNLARYPHLVKPQPVEEHDEEKWAAYKAMADKNGFPPQGDYARSTLHLTTAEEKGFSRRWLAENSKDKEPEGGEDVEGEIEKGDVEGEPDEPAPQSEPQGHPASHRIEIDIDSMTDEEIDKELEEKRARIKEVNEQHKQAMYKAIDDSRDSDTPLSNPADLDQVPEVQTLQKERLHLAARIRDLRNAKHLREQAKVNIPQEDYDKWMQRITDAGEFREKDMEVTTDRFVHTVSALGGFDEKKNATERAIFARLYKEGHIAPVNEGEIFLHSKQRILTPPRPETIEPLIEQYRKWANVRAGQIAGEKAEYAKALEEKKANESKAADKRAEKARLAWKSAVRWESNYRRLAAKWAAEYEKITGKPYEGTEPVPTGGRKAGHPAAQAPVAEEDTSDKSGLVQRIERVGRGRPDFTRPHGIYTTPADVESPHADIGGERFLWRRNPDANVLVITETENDPDIVMRHMARGAGTGVWAARQLLGPEQFKALKGLPKAGLREYAEQKFPGHDWSRYYDSQEIMEGIGGMLAREAGYDAIELKTANREWDEYVALTENSMTPVEGEPAAEDEQAPPDEEEKPAPQVITTPTGQKPAAPKKEYTEAEIKARAEEITRRVAEEAKKKALAGGKLRKKGGSNPYRGVSALKGEFYEIDPADLDDEMVKQIGEMGVALFNEVSYNPKAWKPAMLKVFSGIESRIDDIYDAATDALDAITREARGDVSENEQVNSEEENLPEAEPEKTADTTPEEKSPKGEEAPPEEPEVKNIPDRGGATPDEAHLQDQYLAEAERTGLPYSHVKLLDQLERWIGGYTMAPEGDNPGLPYKANNPQFEKYASYVLGKTIASGHVTMRRMYELMEAAMNRYLVNHERERPENGYLERDPDAAIRELKAIIDRLPLQAVRDSNQETYQQFSTPPTLAWLVNKLAAVPGGTKVLEPSGGTGSLLAMLTGVDPRPTFIVNEIDPERAKLAKYVMGPGHEGDLFLGVDAEYISNHPLFPADLKPDTVVMNPPFSSTDRGKLGNDVGYRHVMTALKTLPPGGRAVIILGEGAGLHRSNAREFWERVMKRWNIRANIGLNNGEYTRYGTTFGNRIIVIDNTGPTPDVSKVITDDYSSIEEAYHALEHIAKDRSAPRPGDGQEDSRNDPTGDVGRGGEELPRPTGGERGGTGGGSGTPGSGSTGRPGAGPDAPGPGESTPAPEVHEPGIEHPDSPTRDPGTRDDTPGGDDVVPGTGVPAIPAGSTIELQERAEEEFAKRADDDDNFVQYIPTIEGPEHTGIIVETKVMASVPLPSIHYRPSLPDFVLKNPPRASALQVEFAAMAGQRFEMRDKSGARMGIFNGDGTGVGKTRQIGLVMWDQWRRGNRKILMLSVKQELFAGLADELKKLGADELVAAMVNLSNIQAREKLSERIGEHAIIYSTYATFASAEKREGGQERSDQLTEWLGPEPLIVFDEAHKAKNAVAAEGDASKTGEKVVAIQEHIPGARVMYASATGATEVRNMAYMTRLGLVGEGTPFPNGFADFLQQMTPAGLAGMEMVARELKAMGAYFARTLSYKGVEYSEQLHDLTDDQKKTWNVAARAWQKVFTLIQEEKTNVGAPTNGRDSHTPFMAGHLRFAGQLITSFKVPTMIDMAEKALKGIGPNGESVPKKSVVISLVGTGQAQTERAVRDAQENDSDDELEFGPKDILISLIKKHYPIHLWEEVVEIQADKNGNPRPVVKKKKVQAPREDPDNPGKLIMEIQADGTEAPKLFDVVDLEARARRDALIKEIDEEVSLPDNPLDQLINYFGPQHVAEITGRKKVPTRDEHTGKWSLVPRLSDVSLKEYAESEAKAFQDGKKHVIIISKKANEGINLHSDRNAKNQRQRLHVVLQVPWSADDAMQSFGRTHRTNEASAPEYVILSTDLGGERRFSSTIARRLSSLGALTKGQRDAGGSNVLAKFNFETEQGIVAAQGFYNAILGNQEIPGLHGVDGLDILRKMAVLRETKDDDGNVTNATVTPDDKKNVTRLLNRILLLEIDQQNAVFNFYVALFDNIIQRAMEAGTLDVGVNVVRGDSIRLLSRETLVEPAEKGGVGTYHYTIAVDRKNEPVTQEHLAAFLEGHAGGIYYKFNSDAKTMIVARRSRAGITNPDGSVTPAFAIMHPNDRKTVKLIPQNVLDSQYRPATIAEATTVKWKAEQLESYEAIEKQAKESFEHYKVQAEQEWYKKSYGEDEIKRRTAYHEDQIKRAKADRVAGEKAVREARDAERKARAAAFERWYEYVDEVPKMRTDQDHIIGGRVIPIWQVLKSITPRFDIRLAVTQGGERLVGPVLTTLQVNTLKAALGGERVVRTPEMIYRAILDNDEIVRLQGSIKLQRMKVGKDKAIVVESGDSTARRFIANIDIPNEKRGSLRRFFIPNDPDIGLPLLTRLMEQYPEEAQVEADDESDAYVGSTPDPMRHFIPSERGQDSYKGNPAARALRRIEATAGPVATEEDRTGEEAWEAEPEDKALGSPPLPVLDNDLAGDGTLAIARKDIIALMSEVLGGMPIRVGKFRHKGAIGIFKRFQEVIRLKHPNDLTVAAHEFAHAVHKQVWGTDKAGRLDTTALLPYAAELEPIAYAGADPTSLIPEGFAEFMRLYLTGFHASAMGRAPRFYRFFEGTILASEPDLRDGMMKIRDRISRWVGQGWVKRVEGQIVMSSNEERLKWLKEEMNFNRQYAKWIAANRPLYTVKREMERALGRALKEDEDFYLADRLLPGWWGKAHHFLVRGTFEAKTLAPKNESLKDILNDANHQGLMTPDEDGPAGKLRRYMVAMRALEIGAQRINISGHTVDPKETGISYDDATNLVREYRTAHPGLPLLAQRLYQYQDDLLVYTRDQGMISTAQLRAIRQLNRRYIPFYRFTEFSNDLARQGRNPAAGRQTANVGNVIKPFKGSDYEILDPIESILYNTYAMISAADRNKVGIMLVKTAAKAEGVGSLVESIATPLQATTFALREIEEAMKSAGAYTEGMNLDALATLFRPIRQTSKGEYQISVSVNGQRRLFQVAPDVWAAMHLLDAEQSNWLLRIMRPAANLLRLGATTLSPEFIFRNAQRDSLDGFMQSRMGFTPGLDALRGLASILAESGNGDDLLWEWRRAGGEHAAMISMDRTNLRKSLKDLQEDKTFKGLRKHPVEALRRLGEGVEAMSRVGEYRLNRKAGKSPRYAALASREVTIDFARSGDIGRSLNQIVPFFNASLQGVDKFIREHKENAFGGQGGVGNPGYEPPPPKPMGNTLTGGKGPKGKVPPPKFKPTLRQRINGTVPKGVVWLTLPTIMLYLINRNNKEYRDMPRYIKDRYWLIPVPESSPTYKHSHFLPIPKPFLWGTFYSNIPERLMEWVDRDFNPRAFDDLDQSMAAAILPGFVPTLILLPAEWYTNKNWFTGRAIEPKGTDKMPAEYRARTNTSQTAIEMAQVLNAIGIEASPAKLENLITGATGGAGSAALKVADAAIRLLPHKVAHPSMNWTDIPGAKAFSIRTPTVSTESSNYMFNRMQDLSQRHNASNARRSAPEGPFANAKPLTSAERHELSRYEQATDRIADITKEMQRVRGDKRLTGDQMSDKLDALEQKKNDIAWDATHPEERGGHPAKRAGGR